MADSTSKSSWITQIQSPGGPPGIEDLQVALAASQEYFGRMLGSAELGTFISLDNDSVASIEATSPNGAETNSVPGVFTVTRTGNTSADLTVNYTLAGTAINGTDYTALPAISVFRHHVRGVSLLLG